MLLPAKSSLVALDVEKRICEVSDTKETKGSLKIFKLGAGLDYSPLNGIWPY